MPKNEHELITQESLQMLLNHNYPFTKVPDNWEPTSETFIHDDVRYLIPNVYEVSTWLMRYGVLHIESAVGGWGFKVIIDDEEYTSTIVHKEYPVVLKLAIETALKKIDGKVLFRKKCKKRRHNKSAMPKDFSTDNNFRRQAALAIMCALLETTKHDVILEPALKKAYAKAAIGYAEELIAELGKEAH